jgi:micrococcal nuclease
MSKNKNKPAINMNLVLSWIIVFAVLSGIGYLASESKIDLDQFTNPKITANSVSDSYKVKHVVDGDTIELEDKTKIRILYLDTPESVKPETPVKCYGNEAKAYTTNLLSGKKVKLVSDKEKKDQYGRGLRIVFEEGVDTSVFENSVNAKLVKNGYARAKFFSPNRAFESQMRKLEKQAQSQNLGLWAKCSFEEAFGK